MNPFSWIVQILAFTRKELAETFRQPRLILTLAVGPFLILLLFGLGYRTANPPARMVFVTPPGAAAAKDVRAGIKDLGGQIIDQGTVGSEQEAVDQLKKGTVDIAMVVPPDPTQNLQQNRQTPVVFIYRAINPVEVSHAQYLAQLFVSVLNRRALEGEIASVQANLSPQYRQVSPGVLTQPFQSKTQSSSPLELSMAEYYTPGVIVLLLQHLAVTFGALSLVRERLLGSVELFRVSPLSSIHALLGKYIGYLFFGGVIGVILTVLAIKALHVPMLGTWQQYIEVTAALLFASLGLGFLLSTLSRTDSQAVQYSMIVLLTSIFFSGFLLDLAGLGQPERLVSWLIPATYGIVLLQDVMLRGGILEPALLYVLVAIGVALFAVSALLLRRQMARQ